MKKPKWLPLILAAIFIFSMMQMMRGSNSSKEPHLSYSDFKEETQKGKVSNVVVFGDTNELGVFFKDKSYVELYYPSDDKLIEFLESHNVGIEVKRRDSGNGTALLRLLGYLFPLIFLVIFFVFISRRMGSQGGMLQRFSSSKARMFVENKRKTTFRDVAGMPEVKEEVEEIIDFLKHPVKYTKVGGKIPSGVLLIGPPGTGKTLLARAVAGEAGVPFLSVSGSEFVEMLVGVGASRVRDLFEQAKKQAPCIVFIDEIDAVGQSRQSNSFSGHSEREQTLHQLLSEMDGFEQNRGIIVIAATNRPDVLDPALRRPGRFDRMILVPLPDASEREEILRVHTRNKPLAEDVNLVQIAKNTPGFSGADLENLANEAALLSGRKNINHITSEEFESARDKVTIGLARKKKTMTARDRELLKYHEAGHAIAALCTDGAPHPHKVTIIPHGIAAGFTEGEEEERMIMERDSMIARMKFSLGGRAAESIFCNTETSGASHDLANATKIARKMVYEFGMGKTSGLVHYADGNALNFLGIETGAKQMSEATLRELDEEVKRLVTCAYEEVERTLRENRGKVEKLVAMLQEKETVIMTEDVIRSLND